MLARHRQRAILDLLEAQGSVRTVQLSTHLGVTAETVRRDLEALGEGGKLERTHGGALRLGFLGGGRDLPLEEREVINIEEKRAVARAAARLLAPGDTLLLDASSTALELARALPDAPLTVLTNAQKVVAVLMEAGRARVQVVCTGGNLDRASHSYVGPLASEAVRRYRVGKLFCSGNGLDLGRGVSEVNEGQAVFKERAMELAEEVIVLADHTKLGARSTYFFARLDDVDRVVTDAGAEPSLLRRLRKTGVAVTVAK